MNQWSTTGRSLEMILNGLLSNGLQDWSHRMTKQNHGRHLPWDEVQWNSCGRRWKEMEELMVVDDYGWLWLMIFDDNESMQEVAHFDRWTVGHSNSRHPNANDADSVPWGNENSKGPPNVRLGSFLHLQGRNQPRAANTKWVSGWLANIGREGKCQVNHIGNFTYIWMFRFKMV